MSKFFLAVLLIVIAGVFLNFKTWITFAFAVLFALCAAYVFYLLVKRSVVNFLKGFDSHEE